MTSTVLRSADKPRVLFATTVVPIPINAGNKQRTDQSIKALVAMGADVTIVVHSRANKERTLQELYAEYPSCKVVFVGKVLPAKKLIAKGRYFRAFAKVVGDIAERATLRHWMISNRSECPPQFLRALRRESKRSDVFFSNYAKVTPISNFRFEGVKICDTHDLQTRREEILLAREEPNRMIRAARTAIFRMSEQLSFRKFDHLLSISSIELPRMQKMAGSKVCVHYAPATFTMKAAETAAHSDYDVGFIGTRSKANIDGLVWFLSEILPTLIERRPDLTLTIVGRVTTAAEVLAAAEPHLGRITMVEFVEDISTAYKNARVWVCPIRFGTGMKIKAVEALAMGAASVGTSIAFESISVTDGESAFVADEPREFSNKVDVLLASPELARRMRNQAIALFRRDHSIEAYSALLRELITGAR